jgi:predicted transcriptional regulator
MANHHHSNLSRRERQIMDILFKRRRATAAEVMKDLPGNLSDSTVRTHLRILEEKGHVRHEEEGLKFVFLPTASKNTVRRSALRHLIDTFYDGSAEKVVAALIGSEATRLTREELKRIADLVEKARKEEEPG